MIIELMLMLIVVGAGIVFVAWSNTRRRRQDALDRREVEGSTGKLKQELERTATEIIGRMENHVTHLESILEESERNRTQLEGRVVELKKILKKAEGQSSEIRDLLAKLEDAGAEVDSMQRKMETLERRLNVVMSTPLQMQQPIQQPVAMPPIINPLMTQPITPPINPPQMNPQSMNPTPIKPQPINSPITTVPITPPQITKPLTPPLVTQVTTEPPGKPLNPLGPITMPIMRKTEADNEFDKILEESIAAPKVNERPQARESIVLSSENKQPVKVLEADPVKIEATRRRLNEASAEMAANPPEDIPDLQGLKNKRASQNKRDVRQAAIEAIKAVEKQSEIKSKPELKKVSMLDKKIQRRDSRQEITDSAIVKEMLLAGMSIENISRETGLGRSAIEFIQEMIRRQLNRR